MTRIHVELLVANKGVDLFATTAELTLIDKMGFGDRLAGIKRFDSYRLEIETQADARAAIDNLKRVLDRQSTFYNRNKHLYGLECQWDGDSHSEGVSRSEFKRRFRAELAKSLQNKSDTDSGGKDPAGSLILDGSSAFLVEVLVEDDDRSSRDAIAAKLRRDLTGQAKTADVRVECHHRATLWWLALAADNADAAMKTAQHIAVTRRRDEGLLMNPNYQHAEFVSAENIGPVSS